MNIPSIAAAGFLMMFSMGSLYAWSVLITPLQQSLGASRSEISAIFSTAIVTFTLTMLCGSHVFARLGFRNVALLTGGMAAAGFLLAGLGTEAIVAVGLGIGGLFGIANGLGYGLSLQIVQRVWPRRRGLLTGLAVASYTAGSAVFSGLFVLGLEQLGVAGTLIATAGYMALAGAIVFGLLAHAYLPAPAAAPTAQRIRLLRDTMFWTLWLGFFFSAFAGIMVLGHAATIVGSFGAGAGAMALGAGLVAVGNGVGRLTGGWLSDWQPPRRFLTCLLMFATAALLLVLLWPDATVSMVALSLMGVGYGAVAGAYPGIVSRIYGIADSAYVYGRVFTAWGTAGLAGPYVGGLLFDWSGDYQTALAVGVAAAFCGGVTFLAIRPSPAST